VKALFSTNFANTINLFQSFDCERLFLEHIIHLISTFLLERLAFEQFSWQFWIPVNQPTCKASLCLIIISFLQNSNWSTGLLNVCTYFRRRTFLTISKRYMEMKIKWAIGFILTDFILCISDIKHRYYIASILLCLSKGRTRFYLFYVYLTSNIVITLQAYCCACLKAEPGFTYSMYIWHQTSLLHCNHIVVPV
jgi:hypothetical protein